MLQSARQQRGITNARWPGCGAANINNGEKSKQTIYKEVAAQKKTLFNLWIAHQHTHGQNSKQLVF